ncbi:MAG: sialidase family protein [Planctomycetota bacterium]
MFRQSQVFSLCLCASVVNTGAVENGAAVVAREFIFENAPFASCHASTIVETSGGLAAAWFGGSAEGKPDVGIWLARQSGQGTAWSEPVQVAAPVQDGPARFPCWNPVLFQPRNGPLLLFYKAGPNPGNWWGVLRTSADGGKQWSEPRRLPEGFVGPVKNKPVQLPDGPLLCPSSTEDHGWRVFLEKTSDLGATWERIGPLNDGQTIGAIQPSILAYPNGRMQVLCRDKNAKNLHEAWSEDGGKTWSAMSDTVLPNPNSGTDAVMLQDGRAFLVYNHTRQGRSPLNTAISADGKSWQPALVLEDQPGEYSYPAVIQARNGLVHITYTWKRQKIRHVVLGIRH